MVTATYNAGTSIAKVYVDGELVASGSVTYNNFSPYPISIGETYQNNCVAGNMDGAVDEVKIYDRALSNEEIQSEYNLSHSSMVLFLPFNGNANDESGNNNNGTVSGASLTQDRFGLNGRAYQFDGIDDFISIADNPNLFSDELTISWWYKMTEILSGERVVIGWVDGGHRYQQFFNGGQISYLNGYNVGQPGMYFNPIYGLNELNIWKNVVVTYEKLSETTSTTSIYVDGELKQSDNHTLAMDYVPGIDFFIGKNHNGNFFQGSLDDMRIFNRLLNGTEILELYHDSTTYFPPAIDSLVAYFPFNGNVNDESGNMNNGVNHNASFAMDRYGIDNSSLFFAIGVESYVEGINPGNNLPVGNSPRTFSAWINTGVYNQYGSNIFHYGTQQAAPTNFHFLITDVLGLGNGYGFGVVYGNQNATDGIWHFVAGVYEGGTERIAKLYVDGKLDASGTISTEPNTILGTNWRMGKFMEGSTNFQGYLDEVRVYNVGLTEQEVWDSYKSTTTAPTLLFPANNSTINTLTPVIDWDSTVTSIYYRYVISVDSEFTTVIADLNLYSSSYQIPSGLLQENTNYFWKVRTVNDGGVGPWSEVSKFDISITSVEDEKQIPKEFSLMQNYPNPFNPSTNIKFRIPDFGFVSLKVYDVLGNEVATLVNEDKTAGSYEVKFDAAGLSSGIYFYKLQAGSLVDSKKMILLR